MPYGELHLAAVHAAETGEVDHYGLVVGTGIGHSLFVVEEHGLDLHVVEVEILRGLGGSESADRLAGGTPKAGNHVDGEGEGGKSDEVGRDAGLAALIGVVLVVGETEPAEEVEGHGGEDADPDAEEGFAVEQAPSIGEVGNRKELEGKGKFEQTQTHLHLVHPVAAAAGLLQHAGEEGEEGEGNGEGDGKAQHADGGGKAGAAAGADLNEQEADDGTRAAEADEAEGKGHEEDAEEAGGGLRLAVDTRCPAAGEGNLETSEETGGKDNKHQEEEDVEDGVRGEVVEG